MANEIPTRHGFAEINGAQLYYEVAGSGKPVVLVHAGIADHRMWDDQFVPFAERYQVIRFDQRGFGQSSAPAWARLRSMMISTCCSTELRCHSGRSHWRLAGRRNRDRPGPGASRDG